VIALAVAAPIVAKDIQRDKEVEAVHRGKQYTRAIKLYYKRFGNYPTTIAMLENTNNIRYLRKRYIDPITGKDDWRLIHVGQAKVPVMGFFGQPLQPSTGSLSTGMMGNGTGSVGGSTTGGSTFGGSPGIFGSGGTGTDGTATAGGGSGAPAGVFPGASGGTTGATGTTGTTGTTNGFGTSAASLGSGGSLDGGGPIVGVGIPVSKKSLIVYHKQDAFNKWEFTYDPLQDQMTVSSSSIPGATPGGSAGTPGIGTATPSTPTVPTPSTPSGNGTPQN
jgi:hypothetical protein